MNALRFLFGWLGRKAVLYVALVAAIAMATVLTPWLRQVVAGGTPTEVRAEMLTRTLATIKMERERQTGTFKSTVSSLRFASQTELHEREGKLRREHTILLALIENAGPAWMLAVNNQRELLENERRRLRVAWIEQELLAVAAANDAIASNGVTLAALTSFRTQQLRASRAVGACNGATRLLRVYESRWRWRFRQWWESAEHRKLAADRGRRCTEARSALARRDQLLKLARARSDARRGAYDAFRQAAAATTKIDQVGTGLQKDAERAGVELSGSVTQKLRLWSGRLGLPSLQQQAALALVLIIASPFLIRLFCYFVLAPLAMRRPSIRLNVPEGAGAAILPAPASTTSVAVRLEAGEELLVRQDYLQTTSHAGTKRTQWFLHWRKPLTSFAAGLTFLTRIRGDGEVTTVSAVRDPLAEVTILTLPEGACCVLQPRAIAALKQPAARRLRITSHWRIGSLNAWLTLQLRYLVFHGPSRIVVKGSRGVRVESAEKGRVFGQNQLVGFSADLGYAVTRTETFWPYFLGREQLLKDRLLSGEGVLIVEEAPLTAPGGGVRRGIEGMLDAGMKAFGL